MSNAGQESNQQVEKLRVYNMAMILSIIGLIMLITR